MVIFFGKDDLQQSKTLYLQLVNAGFPPQALPSSSKVQSESVSIGAFSHFPKSIDMKLTCLVAW